MRYKVEIQVMHTEIVYVEADSKDEAEELALMEEEREVIHDDSDYDANAREAE